MWSALAYHVILTHLDMTPFLRSAPPPLFSRDISVRWTRGRLPRTWFQFISGESFPPSELLCFSREDFLSGNLVLSAHFLNWCRIICFTCLVAMDNGSAAVMPYESDHQKCFMFPLSRKFVWGLLLFLLLPLISMQVFPFQRSYSVERPGVGRSGYRKTTANSAVSHKLFWL